MKRFIIVGCFLFFVLSFLGTIYTRQDSTAFRSLSFFWSSSSVTNSHNVVYSTATSSHEYFKVDCGGKSCMNPNILPHPFLDYTYIVVAQLNQEGREFVELVCNAQFTNNTLRCITEVKPLPIVPTHGDKCVGDLQYLGLNSGPHDARVFMGPQHPFTIFGSNSMFTCFGQWVQDLRSLMEWGFDKFEDHSFTSATELQRPPPWGTMEKNWFLFFDHQDQAYLHYDVSPNRVFAKVESNGQVGPDLALLTADHDSACMKKLMPKIGPQLESIHQATNSLSITMCKRYDPDCSPNSSNTFIFTIFQHKTYFNFHALYEPYVMMMEQTAPFQLHAFSRRPIWINGRRESAKEGKKGPGSEEGEMLYVTSISWKHPNQKYHGYIDDVLFVAFGIEDERAGAIDIVAGDILGPDVVVTC